MILATLAKGHTVLEAANRAGCSRAAVFHWRHDDPGFAAEFDAALDAGTDVLEAVARRRAFRGSDALLIFLLKARDPHRFNRRMIGVGQDEQAPPIHLEHESPRRIFLARIKPEIIEYDATELEKAEAEAAAQKDEDAA